MGITAQSTQEIESRESTGNITLNNLREVAEALDMKLVYGFIPREGSLNKMLEKQAYEVARKIVLRTNHTMKLEDQAEGAKRIEKAIRDLAEEIKHEMPRYLWN
jgi:predicted DNA-binding mobile mystery protein A